MNRIVQGELQTELLHSHLLLLVHDVDDRQGLIDCLNHPERRARMARKTRQFRGNCFRLIEVR